MSRTAYPAASRGVMRATMASVMPAWALARRMHIRQLRQTWHAASERHSADHRWTSPLATAFRSPVPASATSAFYHGHLRCHREWVLTQSTAQLKSAGCAGSIKRWGMKRGLMTHGSKSKRQHGSIGASATPSRVLPGLKMAGQMGNSRVKIRKVKVGTSNQASAGKSQLAVARRLCVITSHDRSWPVPTIGLQRHLVNPVTESCPPDACHAKIGLSLLSNPIGLSALVLSQADASCCSMARHALALCRS